ncbi:ABC transporter permease [Crassaminicella profunda]|uniref:ABC transporter permease n=1 Tax=Crassaminicella profunda TaxID=1286698 RepID=UPI001CA6E111|nr:ABC transporter permease [Crassaminicella profunda]QZY54041.1 ABC transporter permease [Crassaminicella profunda]
MEREPMNKHLFKMILATITTICVLFLCSPAIELFKFCFSKSIFLIFDSFVLQAIIVSLKSTIIALIIIIIMGIPTAYYMANYSFLGKGLIEIILELPLVLPPAVAGILLLITFGRNGHIGRYLAVLGIQLPFSFTAVVMAQLFVSLPIFIKTSKEGFEKVDCELKNAGAALGLSEWQVFKYITLPLSKNTLLVGAVLSWARSLAEFGATILFAGNLAGKTQTLPLAIYIAMEKDLNLSMSIAVCLVVISVGVLVIVKGIHKKEIF